MNHKKYVRNYLLLTLPLSLIGFSTTNLQAQTWTETASGTYNWDDNVNWGSSPFPKAIDAVADVSIDQPNPQTVDLNQAITVGTLNFEDNGATTGNSKFNIAAGTGGSLIFQTSSGNALVSLSAPSTARRPKVTISADMVMNSNTTFEYYCE